MKKLFRIVVVVSMALAVLACAGCGKEEPAAPNPDQQPESKAEIAGEQKTWGSFQIFVPDGMTLTGGSLIDIEDPDSLWIQPEEFSLECFQITKTEKDTVDKEIKAAKGEYETSEIGKFSAGKMSWTGISYMSGNQPVQILKGVNGGDCVEVILTGYEYNSDMAMAVLEGIQILQ